jgi:hypothetical protein
MPSKIGLVSQDFLVNAALPQHGSTYTVISHKFVIDTVKDELNNNGFFIEEESYRATHDAAIAVGVYKLTHKSDPELSMAFAWTNSYNKQVKFKAVVGAISNVNGAFMILGEQGSWIRKHTGTADLEAKEQIVHQIQQAGVYYKQLLTDRDTMKNISLTKRAQSQLLGILFADYGILEVTGASNVKQQMIKPGFVYSGGSDTLWAFYNHVIYAIQENHPKTWLEEQRMIHYIITHEFNMIPEPVVSAELPLPVINLSGDDVNEIGIEDGQTDLIDLIEEMKSESESIKLDITTDPSEEEFMNQSMTDETLEEMARNHQEEEEYSEMVRAKEIQEEIAEYTEREEQDMQDIKAGNELSESLETSEESELEEVEEEEDASFEISLGDEDDDEDDYDFL